MLKKYKMHIVRPIVLKKTVLIPGSCLRFKQNTPLQGPHQLPILPKKNVITQKEKLIKVTSSPSEGDASGHFP